MIDHLIFIGVNKIRKTDAHGCSDEALSKKDNESHCYYPQNKQLPHVQPRSRGLLRQGKSLINQLGMITEELPEMLFNPLNLI